MSVPHMMMVLDEMQVRRFSTDPTYRATIEAAVRDACARERRELAVIVTANGRVLSKVDSVSARLLH